MNITRITTFRAKGDKVKNLREFLVSIIPLIAGSQGWEACQ